jgi:hypothetical protein
MSQNAGRPENNKQTMTIRAAKDVMEWLHRDPLKRGLGAQLEEDVRALKRLKEAAVDDRFKDLPFHVVLVLMLGEGK